MHSLPIRVYYEDTDAGGIVYYANYLKFCERGRTEFLRAHAISNSALMAEDGKMFVVRNVACHYKRPAYLDDMLELQTSIDKIGKSSIVMHQVVARESQVIFDAVITLVCVDKTGKPAALPASIRNTITPQTQD
ncbi:MAG: tol-pal system-associated acyl-CoA thioesterase [Pseudomonadota bacterium]